MTNLPETKNQIAKSYQQPPSISTKLPWRDYYPEAQCFCLDDGRSVAAVNAAQDLNTVAQTFVSKLEASGVKVKRYGGKEFYDWMVRWFNPAPRQGNGNPDVLLSQCPYPGNEQMPWGYDFSEKLFFSVPESEHKKGIWYFDGKPGKS